MALLPIRYDVRGTAPTPADRRLCYVLETDRRLDQLILEDLCAARGWRIPLRHFPGRGEAAGQWSVRTIRGWLSPRAVPRERAELGKLLAAEAALENDVLFVPVTILWGRAPSREHSWLELLFAESWNPAGRIRSLLRVAVHGRNVLVKIGDPIPLSSVAGAGLDAAAAARRMSRMLRSFFQRQRTISIGPDLSHRRLLLDAVLASPLVEAEVKRRVRTPRDEARIRARARRYAKEIAADYSYPTVRIFERLFTWLWNRLYEGVDVRHIEDVGRAAGGAEIVYVPSHRSHIDYMLLAYVVYRHGLAPPHTAAGANLDLPIVGPMLRRGGAFFVRRSFKGDVLYGAVFRSYFELILARGFPVEYFVEGTRSRTGRLLKPKLGLLSMTVQSFLSDHSRALVLVPVYFGYEKLIEGQTFMGELRGRSKKQESLGGLVRSLAALKQKFGRVQVSFGQPIPLGAFLDEIRPEWAADAGEDARRRPEWLPDATRQLGRRIMTAINEAAVLNPVDLIALVMLSTPKQAILETELEAQLELYLALSRRAPYAERTGLCNDSASAIIAYCENMRWLSRRRHAFGDILYMDERTAILASYFRNNVVHLFVLPSLIAAAYNTRSELAPEELERFVAQLYPCLRSELYLRLAAHEIPEAVRAATEAMLELGLLVRRAGRVLRPAPTTGRHTELDRCAQIIEPFIERYYLSLLLLLGRGSGALRRGELVRECSEVSEQLAVIYSLDSPDLFHASLFENLVAFLVEWGIVTEAPEGGLAFEQASLEQLAAELGLALRPAVRQTLSNLAGVALTRPSGRVPSPGPAASRSRA
ncbi:MAG TPA: glycerol-3-phosphate 1-O-acyltransferase PlsB [Gammaproteobacteria bacterium]|nr:glycerol-3-phosphate 1-O-acyltransferase PlsB [Gammaproteobacteria bacterium]